MQIIRTLALLVLTGTAGAFSCSDKTVAPTGDCGCNGMVTYVFSNEPARMEFKGDKQLIRIFVQSQGQFNYTLAVCNPETIPAALLQDGLSVRISGQHHKLCSDTGRYPGYPLTLTQIKLDSTKLSR